MKKVLSLFVTIALLTTSMVQFTGCQNLMGTDAPSVETPKAQKHRITLAHNGVTLEGGYAGETTYLILPNVMDTKVNPAYTTVLWADITFKDAITDEILDIPVDIKNECVYFTMPDRDIIFSAKSVVESVSSEYKNGAPNEPGANCSQTKNSMPETKFKFGYYYKSENEIDKELKSLVKKAKRLNGKDCWVYEITGWIDPSDCEVGDNWYDSCYFYVDGLVRYSKLRFIGNGYAYNTNLCILTQDEKGNYSGTQLNTYPNGGDTPIEP